MIAGRQLRLDIFYHLNIFKLKMSRYPPSIIQLLKYTIKHQFYIFFIRNT